MAAVAPAGPFVGRAAELGRLGVRIADAAQGRGGYVLIAGPAGIGKSRLVEAAIERFCDRALSAQCERDSDTLAPWVRILDQIAKLSGGSRVTLRDTSGLGDLAERIVQELARLTPPVVIVLEDLHDADDATLEVLAALTSMLDEEPVLVVATERAPRGDDDDRLADLPLPAEEIILGGLSMDEIASLYLQSMQETGGPSDSADPGGTANPRGTADLGGAADLARHARSEQTAVRRSVRRLFAETGGNPLAVHALMRPDRDGAPVLRALLGRAGSSAIPDLDLIISETLTELPAQVHTELALVALCGDLHSSALTRVVGDPDRLRTVLGHAGKRGLLSPELPTSVGTRPALHPRVAELLIDGLDAAQRERLHARIARRLLRYRGASTMQTARHALRAGAAFEPDELAALCVQAGAEGLEGLAFADAERFFAEGHTYAALIDDVALQLRALLGRSEACQRQANLTAARELAVEAGALARRVGQADALAEAAVRYAYPASNEWQSGDPVAAELLAAAEQLRPSPPWLVRVLAARAVAEMRLPRSLDDDDQQWHWIVRPQAGQPLAERALRLATDCGDDTAVAAALLAWRNNHRAPRHLPRRRKASAAALQYAQRHPDLELRHEATLRYATDELEAGNRDGFDEAVLALNALADRTADPRIRWRAGCLRAASGMLDDDPEQVLAARHDLMSLAEVTPVVGAHVVDGLLFFGSVLLTEDFAVLAPALEEEHASLHHPIGRAGTALLAAALGRAEEARRHLDLLRPLMHEETSLLWSATIAVCALCQLDDPDPAQAHWLIDLLTPYRDHGAIDSECLLPLGPVSAALAALHETLGASRDAAAERAHALAFNAGLRSRWVTRKLGDAGATQASLPTLTERQHDVLTRLAAGRSNAQIATDLHVSVSTIIRETMKIYRELGVEGRAQAVSTAHQLGLITAP